MSRRVGQSCNVAEKLYTSRAGAHRPMRIAWDEAKRQDVNRRRQIDFAVLDELLRLPYVQGLQQEDPEQYWIIGFGRGRLLTFIVEERQDAQGDYLWVVTAWHATRQEQQVYERETR